MKKKPNPCPPAFARIRCRRVAYAVALLTLSGCSVFRPQKHITAVSTSSAVDSTWNSASRTKTDEAVTTVETVTTTLDVPAGPAVAASAPLATIVAGDSLTVDEGGVTASASYDPATRRVRLRARRKATAATKTEERRTTATKTTDARAGSKGRVTRKAKAAEKRREVVKPGGVRWRAFGFGLLALAVAGGAVWFWLLPYWRRRQSKEDGLAR